MEEQQKPEDNKGLLPGRYGCHFCELTFKSQSSRSNHHKKLHPNKHRWLKSHRKSQDYLCKHCNIGFGSRRSKWNHQQRCQSNPEILKRLKMVKKQNSLLKNEAHIHGAKDSISKDQNGDTRNSLKSQNEANFD